MEGTFLKSDQVKRVSKQFALGLGIAALLIIFLEFTNLDFPIMRAGYKFYTGSKIHIGKLELSLPKQFFLFPAGKHTDEVVVGGFYDDGTLLPHESQIWLTIPDRIERFSLARVEAQCLKRKCKMFYTQTIGGVVCGVQENSDTDRTGYAPHSIYCVPPGSKIVVSYQGEKSHFDFFAAFFTSILETERMRSANTT